MIFASSITITNFNHGSQRKKEFSRGRNDAFPRGGRDIMSPDRFSNEEKGASGFSLTKNVCPLSRVHYITTCITESVYTAQWIKQGLFSFFYFPPLHPVNRLHLGKKLPNPSLHDEIVRVLWSLFLSLSVPLVEFSPKCLSSQTRNLFLSVVFPLAFIVSQQLELRISI